MGGINFMDSERNFEAIAGYVAAQQMLIETIIVEAIRSKWSNPAGLERIIGNCRSSWHEV